MMKSTLGCILTNTQNLHSIAYAFVCVPNASSIFLRDNSKAGASAAILKAFQAVTQTGYKTWIVKILMAI